MGLEIGGGVQDYRTTAARSRRSSRPSPVSVSSGWKPVYYPSSSSSSGSSGGGGSAPAPPPPSRRQRNLRRRGRSVSYHGPRSDNSSGWGVRVRIGRLSDGAYGIERWTSGGTRQVPTWS